MTNPIQPEGKLQQFQFFSLNCFHVSEKGQLLQAPRVNGTMSSVVA